MLLLLQEPSEQHNKADFAKESSSLIDKVLASAMGRIPCLPVA